MKRLVVVHVPRRNVHQGKQEIPKTAVAIIYSEMQLVHSLNLSHMPMVGVKPTTIQTMIIGQITEMERSRYN